MKKIILLSALVCLLSSGCATLLSGRVDKCQATKPAPGESSRKIRAGYFILSLSCGIIPLGIDFATEHIYKPCPKKLPEKK